MMCVSILPCTSSLLHPVPCSTDMLTLLRLMQVPAGYMQPTVLPSGRCLLLRMHLLAGSRQRCLTAPQCCGLVSAKLVKRACHLLAQQAAV